MILAMLVGGPILGSSLLFCIAWAMDLFFLQILIIPIGAIACLTGAGLFCFGVLVPWLEQSTGGVRVRLGLPWRLFCFLLTLAVQVLIFAGCLYLYRDLYWSLGGPPSKVNIC